MANGFDRLEKFFSAKRKASAVSSEPSTAPSSAPGSPTEPSTEPAFPSPSFIRPKTSRMAAREEFRAKQPTAKFPSTPDDTSPERNASTQSNCYGNTAASRRLRACRARSSSVGGEYPEQLASCFRGFEFPKPPPSRQGNAIASGTEHNLETFPNEFGYHASRPGSLHQNETSTSRFDTPPSSDPEDSPLTQRRPRAKKLQIVPHKAPPTPESSPEIGPVSDWQLREYKPIDILDEGLCKDIQLQLEKTFGQSGLGEQVEQPDFKNVDILPTTEPVSPEPSLSGASLQEPDFDEFLNLSDDHVAESQLEDLLTVQEPVTVTPSVSSLPLRDPPLLTLEPPCASQAATAAAFEAARIASRYNFDMLYVVNLWPEDSASEALAKSDSSDSGRMTGRLLGAYGLHNSPSPFQISADVHIKVLRSEGWLEYRDEQALSGDFGRAYACSFYPGRHEGRGQSGLKSSPQRAKDNAIDRGIVFAAYRKPGTDGSMQYSNPEELAFLRRDVEAMVEMLIDVHVASRLRQPPLLTRYPNETGPMPIMSNQAGA